MKQSKCLITSFFILCVFVASASAWNRHGHLLVSSVAYRALSENAPDTLAKITLLLRSHPDFTKWRKEYNNFADVKSAMPLDGYIFIRAAAWPDDVRSPINNPENHPNWHFINYPMNLPATVDFDTIAPTDNIFVGIDLAVTKLESSTSSKREKARKISWIIHLVGDAHQPLHTVALKNATYPNGDKGGNSECIRPGQPATRKVFHSYWDGLTGDIDFTANDVLQAFIDSNFFMHRENDLKFSQFAGPLSLQAWTRESADFALNNAYQFEGATIKTRRKVKSASGKSLVCPTMPKSEILSDSYVSASELLAVRRIIAAGYRLAQGFKEISIQ
jgi:hypothetical protein